jgi:heme/copper-type cytochrome/quinol oxidase subunit 3
MMKQRLALELSTLPLHGYETASLTWWGTLMFILIEGTGFAIVAALYLYLASVAPAWPMDAPPPDLLPGTLLTLILLASLVPNNLLSRWAVAGDLSKVRIGIVIMTLAGVAPLIPRIFEFPALNVSWDTNAYGSTLWALLGLHTTHLITDVGETIVLAVLMYTRHGDSRRRFGDVQDNAMYWNFVVLAWIPIYALIYWVPRL